MSVLRENGSQAVQEVRTAIEAWLYKDKKFPLALYIQLVGSTAVVGEGQDYDVIVAINGLNDSDVRELWNHLVNVLGYKPGGSAAEWAGGYESLKLGAINLLLCDTLDTYNKWLSSHNLVKWLHDNYGICADKAVRIKVHQHVMGEVI